LAFTRAAATQLPEAQLSALVNDVTNDCQQLLALTLESSKAAAATAAATAATAAAAPAAPAVEAGDGSAAAAAAAARLAGDVIRVAEAKDAALAAFADAMGELQLWLQPGDVAERGCKVRGRGGGPVLCLRVCVGCVRACHGPGL